MSIDWKKIAVAAIAAFLLSILTGAIRGVSFWTLVFRAFFFAVISGGILQGIILLAKKALPELFDDTAFSAEAADSGDTGKNVDIVLPEEGGMRSGHRAALASRGKLLEDDFDGEFAEEVEEIRGDPILAEERDQGKESEASSLSVRPPDVLDDVDVLPDLDGFADVFAPPAKSGSEEEESEMPDVSTTPSFSPSSSKEGAGAIIDPAVVAAAMRTLIKRDLKG